jgi:hypothetical protein
MSDGPDDLVLRPSRQIDERTARMDHRRTGVAETRLAPLDHRARFDRIGKRLGPVGDVG